MEVIFEKKGRVTSTSSRSGKDGKVYVSVGCVFDNITATFDTEEFLPLKELGKKFNLFDEVTLKFVYRDNWNRPRLVLCDVR